MTAGGAADGWIGCSIRLKAAAGLVDNRAGLPSDFATRLTVTSASAVLSDEAPKAYVGAISSGRLGRGC
jgi:hypothetical protein